MHNLRIQIAKQPHLSPLPSNTALFDPTKEGLRRRLLEAVDEHRTGLQLATDALSLVDVLAPDAGAETGVGVVCAADDFVYVAVGLGGDDGACERERLVSP